MSLHQVNIEQQLNSQHNRYVLLQNKQLNEVHTYFHDMGQLDQLHRSVPIEVQNQDLKKKQMRDGLEEGEGKVVEGPARGRGKHPTMRTMPKNGVGARFGEREARAYRPHNLEKHKAFHLHNQMDFWLI